LKIVKTVEMHRLRRYANLKLLMGSKVIQSHSFGFAVSQDTKKNRMKSKKGLITTIIYSGEFNYISKTSYGDYVVKRCLSMRLLLGRWESDRGGEERKIAKKP